MTEPQKPMTATPSAQAPRANPEELESWRRAEQVGAQVMKARSALRKGEMEAAKAVLKEVFALSPGDLAALELLGDIYLAEGETEKALSLFERAVGLYPKHAPFEEKLALCKLDLAEMEDDKLARQMLLEGGIPAALNQHSVAKAVTLSALFPGAGQFYNDEYEKGGILVGAALVANILWYYPFWESLSNLPKPMLKIGVIPNLGPAYDAMGGLATFCFWLGLLLGLGVYAYALVDAATVAREMNRAERRKLGL